MGAEAVVPQSKVWYAYYEETDPDRRMKILSEGLKKEPDNKLIPLRRSLWKLRYSDPQNPAHRIDQLLWQIVNILCVYRMSRLRFSRKNGGKEIRQIIKTMGFEEASAFGDAGKQELYLEFRNAAHRYFAACGNDKSYHKKYLGIVTIKPDEVTKKLARDAWRLSEGIEERFPMGQDYKLFSTAVQDEFFSLFTNARELWAESASLQKK